MSRTTRHRQQWAALLLLVALLGAALAALLAQSHATLIAEQGAMLSAQARVIDQNLGRQMESAAIALNDVDRDYRSWPEAVRAERITSRLVALSNALPGIRTLNISNAAGRVLASNRPDLVGSDVSGREYFRWAATAGAGDVLHLTPPFASLRGVWVMTLVRPMADAQGRFFGVITASLDPEFFSLLLGSVNYAADMWSAIGHDSGVIFLHTPANPGVEGKNVRRPGSMLSRHLDSGRDETVLDGIVAATGQHRLMAQRTVRPTHARFDHALIIAASRDYAAVLAPWRDQAALVAGLFALVVLLAASGLAWTQYTERHHQAQLEHTEALFDRLSRMVPGIIAQWQLFPNGSAAMPYASRAIETVYGLTADEVRTSSAPIMERIHPEDREAVLAAIQHSAESLTTYRQEFRVLVPGQPERWVEAHSVPQRMPDGSTLWDGYVADVSERHAAQQARVAQDAAERASRAKSEFMSRASHELRTPLNAILGFSQLLAIDPARRLDVQQRDQVEHIRKAGGHLLALIDEMLDLSSIEAGTIAVKLEPVSADSAVTEALRLVRDSADRARVTLVFAPPPTSLCLSADPLRLRQVLINLLSNAIKYNRAGGTVNLSLAALGDDQVEIVVADTGLGMSERQLQQLFQPFNRLGAERTTVEGTGIGLSITKRLVELMQGQIEVVSTPAAGSRFRVVLRRWSATEDDRACDAVEPSPGLAPTAQTARV